jgi:hypothetical protein
MAETNDRSFSLTFSISQVRIKKLEELNDYYKKNRSELLGQWIDSEHQKISPAEPITLEEELARR